MTSSALTAAASRYVDRKVTRGAAHKATTADARQGLAWQMYHATPEVRFAATYMANGMSGRHPVRGPPRRRRRDRTRPR